jgi:prepilin-type N-terminal cleavage/methylation domain-containing protein
MRIKAFTLAEILITLLIIGVVASLVIPNLINDIQDQQYKVAWKKAYAEISQATARVMSDNGGTLINFCSTLNTSCIVNNFSQYLSTTKICQSNTGGACMDGKYSLLGNSYFANSAIMDVNSSVFYLSNGSSLLIRWHSQDCTFSINSNRCGWMLIDTNGSKGPNIAGKDVYAISIHQNKIIPYGAIGAAFDNAGDCTSTGNGNSCAAQFLYQ